MENLLNKGLKIRQGTFSKLEQGFTSIEMMIVVAIIGILASVTAPAYQDFIA